VPTQRDGPEGNHAHGLDAESIAALFLTTEVLVADRH
jgi:hypothetical protein